MVLAHIRELHRELHGLSPMSDNCKFGFISRGFHFRENKSLAKWRNYSAVT